MLKTVVNPPAPAILSTHRLLVIDVPGRADHNLHPPTPTRRDASFTEKGLVQLKTYLSEVPAERFKTPMKVSDIPRLFTPETFCKLVIRAQREAPAA